MADRPKLNLDQLLAKLRKAIGKKTLREFAALVPMSAGVLHETLHGKRKPGPTLLDYMGYEEKETRISVYVPKNGARVRRLPAPKMKPGGPWCVDCYEKRDRFVKAVERYEEDDLCLECFRKKG